MRPALLGAGVVLGAMLLLAGCSSQQSQPTEENYGTVEEYENYGPWNDPYRYGYGFGYDPYSPFWYSPYPWYYPYYYPVYPGPWYYPPAPRPRPIGPPIRPRGGGGGGHPIGRKPPAPSPRPITPRGSGFGGGHHFGGGVRSR